MNTLSRLSICLGFIAALAMAPISLAAVKIDSIAAIVNDDIILQSDLSQRLAQVQLQFKSGKVKSPGIEVLTQQVLEQLIIENIQLQLAAQKGVYIAAPTLDLALERIAKSNQLSMLQLEQAILDSGETVVQFREKIRQELAIKEIQETSINARIRVTEREIDRYLASNQGQKLADSEYEIGHILISLSEKPDAAELATAQQKVKQVYAALGQGESFASTAATYSDSLNALEGGNLGWRKGSQLPTLFADPIKTMQVGELSEAIRNGSGFHVIKLLNKRGAGVQSTKQTKVNHILVLPNEIRTPKETQALIEELHQRLVNGAQFYDLARAFSDDANSSANGGDLGWINDGQLPKILQDQVNALANGELSAPIETMNGWHLVQVVERRTKDVGNENLRFQAKRALTQSKFSNELENWLREIRNEAYVEIR